MLDKRAFVKGYFETMLQQEKRALFGFGGTPAPASFAPGMQAASGWSPLKGLWNTTKGVGNGAKNIGKWGGNTLWGLGGLQSLSWMNDLGGRIGRNLGGAPAQSGGGLHALLERQGVVPTTGEALGHIAGTGLGAAIEGAGYLPGAGFLAKAVVPGLSYLGAGAADVVYGGRPSWDTRPQG